MNLEKDLDDINTRVSDEPLNSVDGNLVRSNQKPIATGYPNRVTTSGGLKTVRQLSRIRTTETKYCELGSSLFYVVMFEFEKLSKVLVRMPTPLRKILLWQMQTFAQMGREPSLAPSNFYH
eukprot:scaffold3227_cov63-Cyclotella_meneghiniana.AAC.2